MVVAAVNAWKKAPFLRCVCPLISGIACCRQWPINVKEWIPLAFIFLPLLILWWNHPFGRFRYRWINGILAQWLIYCIGWALTWKTINADRVPETDYSINDKNILIIQIEEPLVEKQFWLKAEARIVWMVRKDEGQATTNNIIVYFPKTKSFSTPNYGSRILTSKEVQPIPACPNPGGFDYQDYASLRHIRGQLFLYPGDFSTIRGSHQSALKKILIRWRAYIVQVLKTFLQGTKISGLAEAILIGYKADLDTDLVQSYSATGVSHIIAISGLHLALIYGLLRFFLRPLGKRGPASWLSTMLALFVLWLFSVLTGASASVLRAAIMFSCIICGEKFSRQISSLNSVSCSAFILLCYDPFLLWDIGFQLSYAAVISMILFQKKINQILSLQNGLLNLAWKSVSVCLAAQLLTMPLAIYYFHQFPVCFLLSNIFAVPLSSIVLIGIILLLPLSLHPPLAKLAGMVVSWLIGLLNGYIEYIERLPFSNWKPLMIDFTQVVLLYIIILFLFFRITAKRSVQNLVLAVCIFCFLLLRMIRIIQARSQQFLIVYAIPGFPAMDLVCGQRSLFLGSDSVSHNPSLIQRFLIPSRNKFRIIESFQIPDRRLPFEIIHLGRKKIIIVRRMLPKQLITPKKIICDLVIISGNPSIRITELDSLFQCKEYVFDSSNKRHHQNEWQKNCEKLGLAGYSVSDKGAFVMKIN